MPRGPHIFTEPKEVTGKVAIWARPKAKYELEDNPNAFPFKYELRTDTPWDDQAVKVSEDEVTLQVPSDIDLLKKTIDTLTEKKKEVLARAYQESQRLQEHIDGLLMLTHQPDPVETVVTTEEVIRSEDTVIERENERFNQEYANDSPF